MDRKMSCEQWSVLYSCGCEVVLRRDSPDCDGTCGDDETLVFLPDETSLDVCGDCNCGPVSEEEDDDDDDDDDDDEQEEAEAGDEDKDENEDGEDEDEEDEE
ncbi:hypothetical protein TEQG_03394 [Trichophyton equinum CBS 127.97]|uniref:Uncharacterized protein n=1 Tax=Trichophyton equinum (strain ATCC MYA-4606 / CBS 127.97) TaxID=559882 RepID=F2PRK5_TRIEC|nr:hypothetical protein TEQG_03394 [Trichophyton equinum CBS 127.97]